MKKKLIIGSIIFIVLLVAGFAAWKLFLADFFNPASASGGSAKAYVSSVANITGFGTGIGSQTKFSGSIEPQKTLDVKKDADKKISALYVTAGQTVKQGDKLFKYDTDDISIKLDQAKLDVENIANKISTIYTQIEDLKKERENASEGNKFGYTLRIQSLELEVKTEEYNKTGKGNDVTSLEKSLSNTVIKSEIDGIIKTINSKNETGSDGQEKPYISILSTGNYRVKGTVTELHINSLSPGQSVIVRSRVNSEQTWNGQIDIIDRENAIQDNQNGMYYSGMGGSGGGATASKYYFYVTLDSYDDLILGQHVFVELDFGQGEKKEGLWLSAQYIISENGKSYVWARSDTDKLEKRQITLGEFDQNSDAYQVKDGLNVIDFIAFPQDGYKNGMNTTTNTQEGEQGEGGTMEGEGGTMEGEGGTMEGEGVIIGGNTGNAFAAPAVPENEVAEKAAANAEVQ